MDKDLEPVYDEQIAPLMARIIAVAKEHNMPFVAQFQLSGSDDEGEGPLYCSSANVPEKSGKALVAAYEAIKPKPTWSMLTVTRANADSEQ